MRLRVLAFENSDEWHSGLLNAHAANMVFKLSVWLNPDKVGSAMLRMHTCVNLQIALKWAAIGR